MSSPNNDVGGGIPPWTEDGCRAYSGYDPFVGKTAQSATEFRPRRSLVFKFRWGQPADETSRDPERVKRAIRVVNEVEKRRACLSREGSPCRRPQPRHSHQRTDSFGRFRFPSGARAKGKGKAKAVEKDVDTVGVSPSHNSTRSLSPQPLHSQQGADLLPLRSHSASGFHRSEDKGVEQNINLGEISLSYTTPPHSSSLQTQTPQTPNKMERRTLPTVLPTSGGAYVPYGLPSYLTVGQAQSTDSTGSCESLMTQIPLPYHLPQGFKDETTYYTQSAEPWATPNINQPSTMASLPPRGAQPKLNPNSASYVPSGVPPTTYGYPPAMTSTSVAASNNIKMGNNSFNSQSTYQSQAWSRDSSFSSSSTYPQNGPQYGPPPTSGPQYGPPTTHFAYTQGGMPALPDHNPYAPYGQFPAGTTEYNPYANIPGQMGNYGSPAMSYTTMASPVQAEFGMGYGDGAGQQAWGSVYNNGATIQYGGQGNGMGGYNNAGSSYNIQPRGSYGGGSNNGQRENQYRGKQNTGSSQNSRRGSNAKPDKVKNKGKNKLKEGGPALVAAPKLSVRSTSPDRNVASQAPSRPESHYSVAHSLASDGTKVDSPTATPGLKPRILGVEFKSERKSIETPQLRSHRGQSISAVATDPARKQSVANWLDQTPTNANHLTLEEAAATIKRHQITSPPKMPNFMSGGSSGGMTMLKPINDSDPFVTRHTGPLITVGPYRGGSLQQGVQSRELHRLTRGGTFKPSVEEALDPNNLPFVEYCRTAKCDNWGVIKIKNIPYNVNRPEVLAFLGRNARIVAESDNEPVHIIMERVTSKTLDCYVEFVTFNEAVSAVQRFESNRLSGRGGRLGQRHVEIELASQEQLMHDLFPKAKNVTWVGSRPTVHPTDPNDPYNSGFQGFVSREELVMLVKHVEAPQRSPFSKECPQRPFECLISTLLKFPWYMVDYISVQDRHLLYKTTFDLLSMLIERVHNNVQDINLTSMLLKRVWKAALKCPGFTPTMKDNIACLVGIDDQTAREFSLAPYGAAWYEIFTIGPKPYAPQDLILWYVAIIREVTEKKKPRLSLAEQAESGESSKEPKLFGELNKYIGHNKKSLHNLTLAQVAKAEWAAFEQVLRMALTPALEG